MSHRKGRGGETVVDIEGVIDILKKAERYKHEPSEIHYIQLSEPLVREMIEALEDEILKDIDPIDG
jgi:hypothetical protein